ncbi:hypothetical protein D6783_03320 [Candidatus Woesearchaeota archaeon]|nr:MAG: hypothetical protein D6783_03320 [Candidatus Woesearchaeota archaeon]
MLRATFLFSHPSFPLPRISRKQKQHPAKHKTNTPTASTKFIKRPAEPRKKQASFKYHQD